MSESKTSQSQHPASFWADLAQDQLGRFEAVCNEMGKIEEKNLAQMRSATEEAIKLVESSFTYGAKLAAEGRRLAVEAAQHATQLMTFKV